MTSPLQEFIELGGKPELFLKAPTDNQLRGLVEGMKKLKAEHPQYWREEE